MRQLPFFMLFVLALGLGGCASGPTTAVCARVSSFEPRPEFALPQHRKSLRRMTASHHHRVSHQVAALPQRPKDDTPEPRPTSTEWWMRENARLGKAIIICRGCLPATTANASLPKPAALSSQPDLQAIPTGSLNRLEGSIGVETRDQP